MVSLEFVHNHKIQRQEHTRFGTVSQETKDECISLFEQDLTPSAAFYAHQHNIKKRNPDNCHILLGDRRICPDLFWPFKFYHKWIIEKLESYDGIDPTSPTSPRKTPSFPPLLLRITQSTALSRRVNVTRGRQAALRGAPRKGHTGKKHETDENGIVRFKLPGSKKKRKNCYN